MSKLIRCFSYHIPFFIDRNPSLRQVALRPDSLADKVHDRNPQFVFYRLLAKYMPRCVIFKTAIKTKCFNCTWVCAIDFQTFFA